MRILVVEDNHFVQQGIARALKHEGFSVTTAGDALSALAALESSLFDCILCDIKLPLVDGVQLYQQIVEDHPSLSNRVVFVTAMVSDPKVKSFLDRTGRPVLAKPFELRELLDTVKDVTGKVIKPDQPILGVQGADRDIARRLPDEFLSMAGSPAERVAALVDQRWPTSAEDHRRELEQMLLILLEPLSAGGAVTEDLRRRCEEAVMGWVVRQ